MIELFDVTCSVPECDTVLGIRINSGLCDAHWYVNDRYGTPTPEKRCVACGDTFRWLNSRLHGKSTCTLCHAANKLIGGRKTTCNSHHLNARQFLELLEAHDYTCALCHYKPNRLEGIRSELEIDHDQQHCANHRNKRGGNVNSCGRCVRGLLCQGCNIMVGRYESCKGTLTIPAFDEYLKRPHFVFKTPYAN